MSQNTVGAKRKLLSSKLGVFLTFTAGDEQGRDVPLVFSRTILGRKNADILVRDIKVSSSHLAIELTPNGFRITDLGSSNGTFIHGKKIKQRDLQIGESVQLGDTVFHLERDMDKSEDLLKTQKHRILGEGSGLAGLLDKEFIQFDQSTAVTEGPQKIARPHQRIFQIRVIEGPDKNKHFSLKKPQISIGRVNSDIILKDADVSRKHAMLEIEEGGQIILRDLASSNGTFVNKIRITNCVISPNDQIQVGQTTLLFESAQVNET